MKILRRMILTVLMTMVLAIGAIPIQFINDTQNVLYAEDIIFSGSGDGTADNPYEIESVEHLKEIGNFPNSYFRLVKDIDISTESNWEKIPEFSGELDGADHTILNLKIDSSSRKNEGLFGVLRNATVKNLKIENASVSSYYGHVGLLAGYAYQCNIINCRVSGEVWGFGDGGSIIGGVVGELEGGSIIESSFTGRVSGNYTVGGITGKNLQGNIFNCFTTSLKDGDKIDGNTPTGGIVGYNSGNVKGCYNTSKVYGNNWSGCSTGGIAGCNYGVIERCYNTGMVESVSGGYSVSRTSGGIAGLNEKYIKDCYNTGEVIASYAKVYGICKSESDEVIVQNCYNIGELEGYYKRDDYDDIRAYGITNDYSIWTDKSNVVENCYYLDNIPEAGRGSVLSEDAMKLSSSYLGFDFKSVWTSESVDGFPCLRTLILDSGNSDNSNTGTDNSGTNGGNTDNSGSDTNGSGTSGDGNNDAGTGAGGTENGGASAGGSGSGAAAGGSAAQPSGSGPTGATGSASTADSSSTTEATTSTTAAKTKLTTKNTTIKLSKTSYTYDGKAKKPTVKVLNAKGKVLKSSNYTVKYSNNVKAGKATVTIKFKGKYTGTIKATYTIKPKTTAITGATRNGSKVALLWKKQPTQTSGYQIQYATDKKFTKNKQLVTVSGAKKTSKTIKNLFENKNYYFRIRTYKTVNGKKIYSSWSKAKLIK